MRARGETIMLIIISKEAAAIYATEIAKKKGVGILITLLQSGCNGWKYHAEVKLDPISSDEVSCVVEGVTIVTTKESECDIDGLVIRVEQTPAGQRINFWHPDMTGSCGCGESVTLKKKRKK
jgi:iron-sulfur cluster assembly protein